VSDLFLAVKGIIDPGRVVDPPLVLSEPGKGNKCQPIALLHRDPHFAVRLGDGDHLRVLVGSKDDPTRGFRNLPDYLVFVRPTEGAKPSRSGRGVALSVLISELKSSDTGALGAFRQVGLGRFFAEYLVRVATFAAGLKAPPGVDYRGMIARPLPSRQAAAKHATRRGVADYHYELDPLSDMPVFHVPGGDEIMLTNIFWG
jgi:hypothetical protein